MYWGAKINKKGLPKNIKAGTKEFLTVSLPKSWTNCSLEIERKKQLILGFEAKKI